MHLDSPKKRKSDVRTHIKKPYAGFTFHHKNFLKVLKTIVWFEPQGFLAHRKETAHLMHATLSHNEHWTKLTTCLHQHASHAKLSMPSPVIKNRILHVHATNNIACLRASCVYTHWHQAMWSQPQGYDTIPCWALAGRAELSFCTWLALGSCTRRRSILKGYTIANLCKCSWNFNLYPA